MAQFQFKNVECHNFNCEDREWLKSVMDLNTTLQARNDELNARLEDMGRIIETKEVKYEDQKVQDVMSNNLKLTRQVNSKEQEISRQRKEIIMKEVIIQENSEKIKELEEREVTDVTQYRKNTEDKKSLLREINELELKRRNLEITTESLDNVKGDMVVFLKNLRENVAELEAKDKAFSDAIRKKQKYLNRVSNVMYSVLGFKARWCARKLMKADKLIKKNKKDKAKKLLAKLRMEIINLVGNDKDVLLMYLEELEAEF